MQTEIQHKEYLANSNGEFTPTLTPEDDTTEKDLMVDTRAVIPIIFLPGMLSTCLKLFDIETCEYKTTWRPPELFWEKLGQAFGSLETFGYSAEKHTINLNPFKTEVDDEANFYSRSYYDSLGGDLETVKHRGWAGIYLKDQYVLNNLQNAFNALQTITDWDKIQNSGEHAIWYKLLHCLPEEYGAVTEKAQLRFTIEDFKLLQKNVVVQVWAAPYNWARDLILSSEIDIVPRIERALNDNYYKMPVKKVILLTHSLGGLATRSFLFQSNTAVTVKGEATALSNVERVWGVSHSCMPALGAATAYHHSRCGFDGREGLVLGKGSNYIFPLFANGAGVRALMPFKQYKDGAPWLHIFVKPEDLDSMQNNEAQQSVDGLEPQSKKTMYMCLPQNDSYQDIYLSDAWYGLLPDKFEGRLNPAKIPEFASDRKEFYIRMGDTLKFQEALYDFGYHPVTYAHAASQFKSYSVRDKVSIVPTWGNIVWEVSPLKQYVRRNEYPISHSIVTINFAKLVGKENPTKMTVDYYDTANSRLFLGSKYIVLDDKYMADLYTQSSLKDLSKFSKHLIENVHLNTDESSLESLNFSPDVREYVLPENTDVTAANAQKSHILLTNAYTADWISGDTVVPAASGEEPFVRKTEYYVHGNHPVNKRLIVEHQKIKEKVQKEYRNNPTREKLIDPFYLSNYEHVGPLVSDHGFLAAMHSLIRIILDQAIPEIQASKKIS